jgi:hypothetical protein
MPHAASARRGSPSFQQDPMDSKPAQEDKFTESLHGVRPAAAGVRACARETTTAPRWSWPSS